MPSIINESTHLAFVQIEAIVWLTPTPSSIPACYLL